MAAQKKKTDSSCKLLPLPAGKKKLRSTANPASPFFSSNLLPCCCWFAAAATAFLLLSFPSSATVAAAQTPRENDIARSQVLRTLQSQMMSEAATLTPAPTPTSITQETPASAAKHYNDKSNSTSRWRCCRSKHHCRLARNSSPDRGRDQRPQSSREHQGRRDRSDPGPRDERHPPSVRCHRVFRGS